MIEPRQVGKASVLQASLQAARRSDDILVARADLKADAVANSAQLGAKLVETAADHGITGPLLRERVQRAVSKMGGALAIPAKAVAAAADTLGVSADLTSVVAAIEEAFERVGLTPFDDVLAALEAYAQVSGRRTVVFLDEVQEIAAWSGEGGAVEGALATAARRAHRQLTFVFAGSLASALEGLFARERPLYALSDRYELPAIGAEDWVAGLRKRLREGGLACDYETLAYLLEASNGHPLATMYVAKEAFLSARDADSREVERVHVDDALVRARAQLWWAEFAGG